MKVILADGTELVPIIVKGAKKYIQNAERDCLSFAFSGALGLDTLDALFTEENCEKITIIGDDESEAIYKGYAIRYELKKADVESEKATPETEAVTVPRITVAMAQRTYAEAKLAQVASESVDTQLAVAELAELMVGGAE